MASARKRAASPGASPANSGTPAPTAVKVSEPAEGRHWITVLSPDGLQKIKDHKYVPGEYTPLDNFLNPWWFWLTEFFPKWLAPNVITFSGTAGIAITYMIGWYMCPDFSSPIPRWFAFLSAFAVFLYQTLDACDGKQARRIGLQTPMGQLFDHGCDILACLSHHSMGALIVVPGASLASGNLYAQCALQSGLFMAQWEEYYTHILKTSAYGWGVTEMQYSMIVANLAAGIIGPEALAVWMAGSVWTPLGTTTKGFLVVCGWAFNCYALCTISMIATVKYLKKEFPDSWRSKLLGGLRDLTPVLAMTVLTMSINPIVKIAHIRRISQLNGLLSVLYGWQIVIFGMAKMKNIWCHPTLFIYAAVVALSYCEDIRVPMIATTVVTVGVAVYMTIWIYSVTCQLTHKLQIKVWTVPSPADKNK